MVVVGLLLEMYIFDLVYFWFHAKTGLLFLFTFKTDIDY